MGTVNKVVSVLMGGLIGGAGLLASESKLRQFANQNLTPSSNAIFASARFLAVENSTNPAQELLRLGEEGTEDLSNVELWKTTGLKSDFLHFLLNMESCYESKTTLIACLDSIKAGFSVLYPLSDVEFSTVREGYESIVVAYSEDLTLYLNIKEKVYQSFATDYDLWNSSSGEKIARYTFFVDLYDKKKFAIRPLVRKIIAGVEKYYSEQKEYVYGLILNKALEIGFDAHSYLVPVATLIQNSKPAKIYHGVGIEYQLKDNKLLVLKVFSDGPSAKAGLKEGDVVLEIDGTDIRNVSNVSGALRGDIGTTVTLRILRGKKKLDINVTRDAIVSSKVYTELLNNGPKTVGYISLEDFTSAESLETIKTFIIDNDDIVTSYILDLRNNPGGVAGFAASLADFFLPLGDPIAYFLSTITGQLSDIHSSKKEPLTTKALSVLINAYSASASEILAGALRDNGRALLIGERTYGKGSAQELFDLEQLFDKGFTNPGTMAIAITTNIFFQPSQTSNQLQGILPHVDVPILPGMTPEQRFTIREKELYPNAYYLEGNEYPALSSKFDLAPYEKCLSESKEIQEIEADPASHQDVGDYQLFVALVIAECI